MISGDKISSGSSWSRDDDIAFEKALAIYTDETENRWEKIAGVVPGKTLQQIIEHYEILLHDVMMIESGKVHLPGYDFSEETNDKERSILECGIDPTTEHKQELKPKLKQIRRKGIAWTADEHSQFLLGLDKYGKGDWRSISRNFVVTRTPTQVASHAQKYFARLNSRNKNKKRPSFHDVNAGESSNSSTMQGPTTWQNTQATSQPPSQDHDPAHGTPTIWNTQAVSQPSVNIPIYGIPIVGQSMAGPMVLPFGSDMNRFAPPHMAYGVQHHSTPHSFVPSAPFNILPVPYNMTYLPTSR